MPRFAFVVVGSAVTISAKRPKYQNWIRTVREAARRSWPYIVLPDDDCFFEVSVTNYYRNTKERPSPPDVDNILKPILDGMEDVVYVNDNRVSVVRSDRFDLSDGIDDADPDLAVALATFKDFLYVQVSWKEL